MELDSLRDLYIEELKDLYSAEKQIVKALPKMAKSATNPDLKKAFTDHLEQTEGHVERLEQIFDMLEISPRGKKCVGMEGLIEEAKELLEGNASDDVLDAGLISKAQHVEHYEMAGYGTVRAYAVTLGETDHARLLQQTLDEESRADNILTSLAERSINADAATGDRASTEVSRTRSRTRGDREVTRHVASERGGAKRGRTTERKRTTTSRETRAR